MTSQPATDISLDQIVEGLVDTIEGQQAAIEELRATVERTNRPPVTSRAPQPRRHQPVAGIRGGHRRAWWNLDALPAAERERLETELQAWGNWVRSVYRIQTLPSAWADTAALRAEVLALYAAWRNAYRNPAASPDAPADWHDTLDRFIHRIEGFNTRAGRNLVGAVNTEFPADLG